MDPKTAYRIAKGTRGMIFGSGDPAPLIEVMREFQPDDSCLLCGRAPSVVGFFCPGDSQAWGAAENKDRFFRYCLCDHCVADTQKSAELTEKVLAFRHGILI